MKALITAIALLSFVAASTIPMAAQAAKHTEQTMKKKKKPAKKVVHKAVKSNKKSKMRKPSQA
jgi:Ni/Co efflux regulator RcnB